MAGLPQRLGRPHLSRAVLFAISCSTDADAPVPFSGARPMATSRASARAARASAAAATSSAERARPSLSSSCWRRSRVASSSCVVWRWVLGARTWARPCIGLQLLRGPARQGELSSPSWQPSPPEWGCRPCAPTVRAAAFARLRPRPAARCAPAAGGSPLPPPLSPGGDPVPRPPRLLPHAARRRPLRPRSRARPGKVRVEAPALGRQARESQLHRAPMPCHNACSAAAAAPPFAPAAPSGPLQGDRAARSRSAARQSCRAAAAVGLGHQLVGGRFKHGSCVDGSTCSSGGGRCAHACPCRCGRCPAGPRSPIEAFQSPCHRFFAFSRGEVLWPAGRASSHPPWTLKPA
jgi:hypothetical protein